MGLGLRLRKLWHLRGGVVGAFVVALLVATWSVEKISVVPLKLTPRSLEMATAATHVVVDTPTSSILDLRQDTYSLEGLTNRTVLLGNIMASTPVLQSIAARSGVPLQLLQIDAPLTPAQPRAPAEAGRDKHTSDIFKSTNQYRLSLQANPTVPILDVYAQAPDARSAADLANAAVDELRRHLAQLAATGRIPAQDQVRLVQLGRARGTVINRGVRWQVAIVAFFVTFGAACASLIFLARIRDGWLLESQAEHDAEGHGPTEALPA